MKGLMVSLDLSSQSLSLEDISARLRISPSSGSHNKGDARPSPDATQRIWNQTIWRLESNLPKSSPLERHLNNLVAHCSPQELARSGLLSGVCSARVNVGILFDTVDVSISISPAALSIVSDYGANLEISCYPSEAGTIQ
jgi:hypothetical protein